jgi:Fe-Mn family superoxide dismutase
MTTVKQPSLNFRNLEATLKKAVTRSLASQGVISETRVLEQKKPLIQEAYIVKAQTYELKTEFLSTKAKSALYGVYENHVKSLNDISAKLDTAAKDYKEVNSRSSVFRSLKKDEAYNLNAVKLHELFFGNVSDMTSEITMDSLAFLRLQRDWGDFDTWQRDFVACALSARDGWAVVGYDSYLGRYINCVIDGNDNSVPVGCLPVLVLNVHHHAYYKDYLDDKLSYVFAMMRELRWQIVEARMSLVERVGGSVSSAQEIPASPLDKVNNEIGAR